MNFNCIKGKNIEDYPIPITSESTEVILAQMKKSICKIYNDDGNKGTGFFCKLPYPDKYNLKSFLITNNHIIDESHLGKDKSIDFTIYNDKLKFKLIIGDRKVYTSKIYDTTIIEIFEDEDDIKDFLELDFDINDEDFNNIYINKSIYLLHYPNNEKISVSYGIIKSIDLSNNYNILHFCSTDKGSSGSPILNILTNKLIGIHKGTSNDYIYNKGVFLIYPFKEFISLKKVIKNKPNKMALKNNLHIINKPSIAGPTLKRINKEIKDYNNDKYEGFQLFAFIEDKIYGVLQGLPNTLFENGFFYFTIIYTKDYPFKPPKFYFQTKLFHPNIDEYGLVYLDILQDNWSPSTTIPKIIYSIKSMLDEPNISSNCMNVYAANLYIENRNEYEKTVKEYTSKYANFSTVQNELKTLNFEMKLSN